LFQRHYVSHTRDFEILGYRTYMNRMNTIRDVTFHAVLLLGSFLTQGLVEWLHFDTDFDSYRLSIKSVVSCQYVPLLLMTTLIRTRTILFPDKLEIVSIFYQNLLVELLGWISNSLGNCSCHSNSVLFVMINKWNVCNTLYFNARKICIDFTTVDKRKIYFVTKFCR